MRASSPSPVLSALLMDWRSATLVSFFVICSPFLCRVQPGRGPQCARVVNWAQASVRRAEWRLLMSIRHVATYRVSHPRYTYRSRAVRHIWEPACAYLVAEWA